MWPCDAIACTSCPNKAMKALLNALVLAISFSSLLLYLLLRSISSRLRPSSEFLACRASRRSDSSCSECFFMWCLSWSRRLFVTTASWEAFPVRLVLPEMKKNLYWNSWSHKMYANINVLTQQQSQLLVVLTVKWALWWRWRRCPRLWGLGLLTAELWVGDSQCWHLEVLWKNTEQITIFLVLIFFFSFLFQVKIARHETDSYSSVLTNSGRR